MYGHSQELLIKLSLYALQILMVRLGEKVHISLVEVVQSTTIPLSQVILRSLPVSFRGHSQELLIKLSLYALQILMVRWGEKVHISLVEVVQSATPPLS